PDGKSLVIGAAGSPTRVVDVNTGKVIHSLSGEPWGVSSIAFPPEGNVLVCGEMRGTVRVFDPTTGQELTHFHAHGRPRALAFAKDGKTLLTSGDTSVRFWDAANGKELGSRGHSAGIENSVLLPDGRTLITGSPDGTVRQWNVDTGKELGRVPILDPN